MRRDEARPVQATQPASHCVAILLAAGYGRRFAAARSAAPPAQTEDTQAADESGKLAAHLPDGRTLAQAAAESICAVVPYTVAVTRPDTPALHARLRDAGARVLVSDDAVRGMGASLAAAARHLMTQAGTQAQTALIVLADMPWIAIETYRHVAQAAQHHAIVVPTFEGRRGHPVAIHRALWPELAVLDGDQGARALLQRHPVHEVATQDPGILRDVDVPQDLPAAR